MECRWTDFLQGTEAPGHAVQIYGDLDELTTTVSTYLAAGFGAGEPAVVLVTSEHLARLTEALAEEGWDRARLEAQGLLVVADAEEALAAIMQGGDHPSLRAFEEVVDGLLDRFPARRFRAFGELVDLLCARGQTEAAVALEGLWNDLARRRTFSLLCGYHLDVFDRTVQATTLPGICRAHSHVLPTPDPGRLARAVDDALEDVLGAAKAGKVYMLVARELRTDRVPVPQVLLMWLSQNFPALAERVLAAARARYDAERSAPEPAEYRVVSQRLEARV